MSLIRNLSEKKEKIDYRNWEFECPNCQWKQQIKTTLSKRTAEDKATVKEINTSVVCPNCETKYTNLPIEDYNWK